MLLRQQVRSAIETAAKVAAVIPTDQKAVKVINYLKKHFSAKPLKNLGGSNPYSETQKLQATVTPTRGEKFALLLKEQGWGLKKTKDTGKAFWYRALHPAGAHIDIYISTGVDTIGRKPFCTISVYGNKRAKRSTLPYYD